MMTIDANDLLEHENHALTVNLSGPDDDHVALVCEDCDETIAEENT